MNPYSIVTFQEFASFAMQQAPILEALFRQRDREFSETDLTALVEEHRNRDTNNGGTSTPTVVRRLKELRIVEDAGTGEVGSAYRYAEVLADVHEYFAQTLAPISPESIEGAIVSSRKLVAEMDDARREYSGSTVEGRAREMRQRCAQVLKGIEANFRVKRTTSTSFSRGQTHTSFFRKSRRPRSPESNERRMTG